MYKHLIMVFLIALIFGCSSSSSGGGKSVNWPDAGAIAVLPFENIDMPDKADEVAALDFETGFGSCSRFTLVERKRIKEVMEELRLQIMPHFTDKRATELGKLLGARYLIFGTVSEFEGKRSVNVRAVEVESGKVLFLRKADTKDIKTGASKLGKLVSPCGG